jgi:ribosome-associated toxin RatA of RatAB toxin-antitoxin module
VFIALIILTGVMFLGAAPAGKVPPPRDEAALRRMMSRTWNREILPAGASAQTLERLLARGEVALMEDHPGGGIPWSIAAGIMVDAPAESVFKIVTDFDHYPGVIPMTSKAHATPVPGMPNLYEVNFSIELLFSLFSIDYGVYHYHRPPYRTDWAHAAGEFEVNCGFWQLLPADGGKRTMLFYSVYSLPRQAMIQTLYREEPALELMTNVATATVVVRAVKTEAERRTGKKLRPLVEKTPVEEILRSDPETLRRFTEKGKILVMENGPTVYVTGGVVVNATPEASFQVLSDFPRYPEFLPAVKRSEIKGRGAHGPIVYQETQIKLWKIDFTEKMEREIALQPPERITWQIERGGAPAATGYWRLIGQDQNRKCLLINGTTEDIRGMGMMAGAALKLEPSLEPALLAATEIAALDAFKKRIESNRR